MWGTGDTKQLLLIPTLVITSGQPPPASKEVNDFGVEEREFSITVLICMNVLCRYYYERNEPGETLAVNIDTI